jgi:hypothetical protein
MKRVFRPQKSVIVTIVIIAYVIAAIMFLSAVYSGDSMQSLAEAFAIAFGIATAYVISFSLSKVTIKNDVLSTKTFLFSRHSSHISDISSVTYLNNYAGMGEGLVIHYRKQGFNQTMRIGVGAYGKSQSKIILTILRDKNPGIKFDLQTQKLLNGS